MAESLFNLFTSLGLSETAARVAADGRTPAPKPVTDVTGRLTEAFQAIGLDEATAAKAAAGRVPSGPVHIEGLSDAWEAAVKAAMSIHDFNDRQARTYLRQKATDGEWATLTDPEEIMSALRKYADLDTSRDTSSDVETEVKPVAESHRRRVELTESR